MLQSQCNLLKLAQTLSLSRCAGICKVKINQISCIYFRYLDSSSTPHIAYIIGILVPSPDSRTLIRHTHIFLYESNHFFLYESNLFFLSKSRYIRTNICHSNDGHVDVEHSREYALHTGITQGPTPADDLRTTVAVLGAPLGDVFTYLNRDSL